MTARDPSAELMRLANGYQATQAIYVAATLGTADLLGNGPRSSDDLAGTVGVHPGSLYRLLRALAAVGVFHEEDDRRFSLTPMGQSLRSNADRSTGPWAEFVGRPYQWSAWGDLLYGVRTGDTPFRHVHGTDPWEYRSRHPEEGAIFDRAMTGMSRRMAQATVAAYDFSCFGCIVDVGSGHGALLATILAAHPSVRGILFDQPGVVLGPGAVLREAGVADRCEVAGGNFFEHVPGGGDAYLLKTVLHDWDDAEAEAILMTCRRAIGPEGRLLVLERLIPPPNEDPEVKFFDLFMMTVTGGRERTEAEFAALLARAGFFLNAVVRTGTPICVIEGIPV
ncbi:methyltransferase [Belnapia moabensis]|uniref:methyltransferase n=1 Tax=Belnapia moabensis TaxID=365533 RepID=UPI0005BD1745|nr:methyltransferase [Belnapia moabensis]